MERIGQHLGAYQLIRLLGKGGFAEVYLGEHVFLQTQAALKVLDSALAEAEFEHFRTEARTIARLAHPNILRVLEFGIDDRTPYLVMEYAPNGTLRQRHPRGIALPPATILPYVLQIASALQYAHNEKIIHRDIKPENLLLGQHGEVLLSDFGIAVIEQSSRSQGLQAVAGTITYMAPEQLQGHPLPASDQYALGVIIYEWLTGDRLFRGSPAEIASQHLLTAPPRLSDKQPTITLALEAVIQRMLAKDPKERFPTMDAFASAFEEACQISQASSEANMPKSSPSLLAVDLPVGVPTLDITDSSSPKSEAIPAVSQPQDNSLSDPALAALSVPQPAIKAPRKIARRGIIAGLVGVVGLALGAELTWQRFSHTSTTTRLSPPTPTVVLPTPTATPILPGTTLYVFHGHTAWVHSIAWSPDSTRVASSSQDKTVQIWDATTGGNLLRYSGHSNEDSGVYSLAWSPDGKQMASFSPFYPVHVWDVATGNDIFTYNTSPQFNLYSGAIYAVVAWSPNGGLIASSNESEVHVWDAASGATVLVYSQHTQWVTSVSWSPQSNWIVSGSEDKTAQIWDAKSGQRLLSYSGHTSSVIAGNVSLVMRTAWAPDGQQIASGGDATIQVWDAKLGTTLQTYQTPEYGETGIAWSPGGRYLAYGAFTRVVVTESSTGTTLVVYTGHSSAVTALAWSPDGKLLASADIDGTVYVWLAPSKG